jgi:hypothetical protein
VGRAAGKTFSLASTSLRVSLDLKIAALGRDDDGFATSPVMLALTRQEGATTYFPLMVRLSLRTTRTELELWGAGAADSIQSGGGLITKMPIGSWVHVTLALEATATGGRASVSYDGAPGDTFDVAATVAEVNGAHLEIGPGAPQYQPRDSTLLFDSVLADVK